ncbi:MAG: outer membrane beta-barrel protein [Ginsengibacter sp.]
MAEHNFERRVRQEMSDLEIDPSDAVWEKVKIRIEKKKDKRRFFMLFFLLGVLLIGGGYYIFFSFQQIKTSEIILNNSKKINNNDIIIESQSSKSSKRNNTQTIDSSIATTDVTSQRKKVASTTIESKLTNIKKTMKKNKVSRLRSVKGQPIDDERDLASRKVLVTDSNKIQNEEEKTSQNINSQIVVSTPASKNDSAVNVTAPLSKAEEQSDTAKRAILTDADITKDTINIGLNKMDNDTSGNVATIIKTKKPASNNKWNVGFNGGGGISYVGNSVFSSEKALSYDYLAAPGSNANPGGYYSRITPLSPVRISGGYFIGIVAERKLSLKATLTTGIKYTNFAVSNLRGKEYDSLQLQFSGNINRSYRNNFNFIQVPLEVNLQLGKGKKMPLYWHVGISLSTLISSNTLQYKPDTARSYYTDNALFNKIQFGINTGFSIQLFKVKDNPVTVGPYFYYGLSGLAKDGIYSKQHLMFAGLRTQFLFKRK